jgi:hypothetical protein
MALTLIPPRTPSILVLNHYCTYAFMFLLFAAVNALKQRLWDDKSEFDSEKDKSLFRQYEDACERVRNFYLEQHGQ